MSFKTSTIGHRTLVAAVAATVSAGLVAAPPAQALTVAQITGLAVENPYYDSGWGGLQKWVTGAASIGNVGFANKVRSTLYQYYGGSWHPVATTTQTGGYARAKASVYCSGAQTSYSFKTKGEVYYRGDWYFKWSPVVVKTC